MCHTNTDLMNTHHTMTHMLFSHIWNKNMAIKLITLKDRTQLTDCCVNGKSQAHRQTSSRQDGGFWGVQKPVMVLTDHTRTDTLARVPDRWHEPHTCRNQCGCCSNDSFHQASCQCSWSHHCSAFSTDAGLNQHFMADRTVLLREAESSDVLITLHNEIILLIYLDHCSDTVVGVFTRKHIHLCTALKSMEPFKENSL